MTYSTVFVVILVICHVVSSTTTTDSPQISTSSRTTSKEIFSVKHPWNIEEYPRPLMPLPPAWAPPPTTRQFCCPHPVQCQYPVPIPPPPATFYPEPHPHMFDPMRSNRYHVEEESQRSEKSSANKSKGSVIQRKAAPIE